MVVGDFNEIVYSFDKSEVRLRNGQQMTSFLSVLNYCDLCDLGFSDHWYTWEWGRFASTNVSERLNSGVANSTWWTRFPDYLVSHLSHSISDHCSLLIDIVGKRLHGHRCAPFRFQAD